MIQINPRPIRNHSLGGRHGRDFRGGQSQSAASFSRHCLSQLLAATVEEVWKFKVLEKVIQNSGLRRIDMAASATHANNSCAKFDDPDFFNMT
jgi:hypothetical protein